MSSSSLSHSQHGGDVDEESPLIRKDSAAEVPDGEESIDDSRLEEVQETSPARLFLILGGIWIGVFLAALDGTIVATLSGTISNSFDSFTLFSWIASSFFIANAALQPLSGKLTDIFSRRTGLLFSNLLFAVGSLICGLAQEEWVLLLGRVCAGMGSGGLTAICTFTTSDLVPLRLRGVWQGVGNICFGMGSALGGLFGGFISERLGWRWAFLIQVPVIVLSGTVVYFTVNIPVKESDKSKLRRIDFLGAITLVLTVVLLLLGLNSGGNTVAWSHPFVIMTLSLVPVGILTFVWLEARSVEEPIIPVQLLLQRTPAAACLINWFGTMSIFGVIYYIPIYFTVRGHSATESGARMAAIATGAATGSLGSGFIMKATGKYWYLNLIYQTIYLASHVSLSFIQLDTPTYLVLICLAACGLGYGTMLTVTLVALIGSVEHEYQAVITSASYAFRSTGSVIGITLASAAFQNILRSGLWDRFGSEPDAAEIIYKLRHNLDSIKDLPDLWKGGAQACYMDAIHAVFYVLLGLSSLAFLSGLMLGEHTLHKNLARK